MAAIRDSTRFSCSLPPTSVPHQPHPWLVISHGKHMQTQTFFSISQRRHSVKTIPELRNKVIRAYCNEWLVLSDHKTSEFSLLSLISMQTIQLPQFKFESMSSCCLLSSPPTSPDCRVFVFDAPSTTRASILYCKPGDTEFQIQEFEIKHDLWSSAIALNGNIYAMTSGNLYLIDFNGPQPHLIPMGALPRNEPFDLAASGMLVESNGELLLVKTLYYGHDHVLELFGFLISRYDFMEETWVSVESLGDTRALFLNKYWGMSCLATKESGVKGNSIYFVREADRRVYVFDLEKRRIKNFMPSRDVDLRRSKFQWIPPYMQPN